MGFENRKSKRVTTGISLCFWPGEAAKGQVCWGQVANLSETGLAMASASELPRHSTLLLELSVSGRAQPLRMPARVVRCEAAGPGHKRFLLRVHFSQLARPELLLLRRYILQVSDPKLALMTGWGHARFSGHSHIEARYRQSDSDELRQCLQHRSYLSMKELGYLFKFQAYLKSALGSRLPENFKVLGSRALVSGSCAWVELTLGQETLQLMANVLWGDTKKGDEAESGLCVAAIRKAEALKIEKQGPPEKGEHGI
jgi:hypothetical protein